MFSQTYDKDYLKITERVEKGQNVSADDYKKLLNTYTLVLHHFPDQTTQLYYYLGNQLYHENKVDEAIQNFSRAYDFSIEADDTTLKYIIILTFGRVNSNMKKYDQAEQYYRVALPGMAAIYGQSSLEYTRIYFEYVRLLMNLNRLTEAKPMLEALEYFYKTLNLYTNETYLAVIANQAYILQESGNYKEAIAKYNFILEDSKPLKNGDTLEFVIANSNLGEAYREMGDYEQALVFLQKAKRLMQKYKIEKPAQQASIENNLGLLYKSLNNYNNAEESFNYSIQMYQNSKLDSTEEYCTTLSNKADLMRLLGRRDEGSALLRTALSIRKMNFGTNSENYANAMSTYGLIAFEDGIYEVAQDRLEEALRIYEATVSKKHQSYANCLNSLSACYYKSGDLKKAESYKFEAIKIIEETLGKEQYRYISFVLGSVDILTANRNYEKAIQMLNESKELAKKKFGMDHDLYIRSLINLAYVCLLTGKYEESLSYYEEAIEHKTKSLSAFFYTMNRENQMKYLEEIQDEMFSYNTSLFNYKGKFPKINLNDHFEKYFNFQLILKSLLNKNVTEWQRKIAESKDEELKSNYLKWIKLKNDLNDLYKSDFTNEDEEALRVQINDLESYLKKMVVIKPEVNMTFKTIKEKLKPNEAIIDISGFTNILVDTNGRTNYAALIVKDNSAFPECVLLNDNRFKEEKAVDFYEDQMEKELPDSASYAAFYKNLFLSLNGIKKIYVSTKGVYNKINIQSLFNPHIGKYILEEIDVVYLPNLNAIGSFSDPGNSQLTAELFGNPDFNFDFRKNSTQKKPVKIELLAKRFGLTQLADLPGTENELKEISSLLKENKWQLHSYTRSDANEENLRKVKSPKLLHIATHGYFLNDIETSDKKFLGFNSNAFKQLQDMRSGLLLAGASVSTQDSVEISSYKDGILTSREASALNLSNTDLVVLSACQTGLTVETVNMGVIGLQQAFSNAGAKNLILSLWPVDDNATELLMSKFYEYWLKNSSNQNIVEAFKKAQLEVKQKYKHPYYWGAFVLLKN